ncbi:MAG: hypothetical protein M1813_001569 [Trichoglossum hirsutum]|nr:MAG: hypothetical protein M1813_001569 [Trichoglossum hirsutum]
MAYKSNWFDPSVYPGASLFNSKCQIDEFPQNALAEAISPQALRAVDGTENSMQGNDFLQWKNAVYNPCSALLASQGKPPPPITWTWGGIGPTDTRNNVGGIIQKYGFDSSAASQCFATYTKNGIATVVSDHGFRVASTDPLFQARGGLTWSNQVNVWRNDPANLPITNGLATIVPLPVNVQPPPGFLRARDLDSTDLEGLGHNDTSQLTVKRENKRYYIEDEKRQVCHQLELRSNGEGGEGDDESIYNEFCANAIVSETPPEPTTTSPSEGKISPGDAYYIPEPTGLVPQQGQVKLMALTSTVTAVLPTNI